MISPALVHDVIEQAVGGFVHADEVRNFRHVWNNGTGSTWWTFEVKHLRDGIAYWQAMAIDPSDYLLASELAA